MPLARRRPKKKLKRIDAAFDALFPMGFSRGQISRTINKLLKVYDGDDGWPFIEEASYKLVIDTILEDMEEAEKDTEDDYGALEDSGQVAVEDGGSEVLADTPCADEGGSCNDWKDISCLLDDDQCQDTQTARGGEVKKVSSVDCPSGSLQLAIPRRQRKPCYGWISEEEEDDVYEAKIGTSVLEKQENAAAGGGLPRVRKRRSSWDVRPVGM